MSTLGERLDAAIKASGKRADEIAREAGTTPDTISRIRTGKHDNPELQLLIRIALAAKTTVGALLGESIAISPEDDDELLRFRGWIDDKLATIDARQEPNAIILSTKAPMVARSRVADQRNLPFGENAHLVLSAIGDSMIGDGILPDDTLYAIPADSNAAAIGKLIACRLGEAVFVKRLVSEHRRLFLRSANPRYRAITVDAKAESLEILGVVVGRVGKIS